MFLVLVGRAIPFGLTKPSSNMPYTNLPLDQENESNYPIQGFPGSGNLFVQSSQGTTGKGHGSAAAECLPLSCPTVKKPRGLQTDGVMPGDLEGRRTMGPVSSGRGLGQETKVDDLQRALEGEMVNFLRQQNSKLIEGIGVSQRQDAEGVGRKG